MFVQALRYGTGIASAEELEDDAVLLVHHPKMVWVAPARSLAGLRVVAQAVSLVASRVASQVGADVVLELQA